MEMWLNSRISFSFRLGLSGAGDRFRQRIATRLRLSGSALAVGPAGLGALYGIGARHGVGDGGYSGDCGGVGYGCSSGCRAVEPARCDPSPGSDEQKQGGEQDQAPAFGGGEAVVRFFHLQQRG